METNALVSKGLEVAQFYYSAQRYFHQLTLLTEGVAHLLTDRGWKITSWTYGRPINAIPWSWAYDRSILPRNYLTRFEKREGSNDIDRYGFSIWFFNNDPSGELPWVPTAYFFRISVEKEGKFEDWKIDPKIAQVVRPILLTPTVESMFLQFAAPWPVQLAGDGVDNQLQSISIVPFPLACVETSEHLETITTKAVRALSEKNPDLIKKDEGYLKLVWAI